MGEKMPIWTNFVILKAVFLGLYMRSDDAY